MKPSFQASQKNLSLSYPGKPATAAPKKPAPANISALKGLRRAK